MRRHLVLMKAVEIFSKEPALEFLHESQGLITGRFVAVPTACLVDILRADNNSFACTCRPLGAVGGTSTNNADGQRFGNVLSHSK